MQEGQDRPAQMSKPAVACSAHIISRGGVSFKTEFKTGWSKEFGHSVHGASFAEACDPCRRFVLWVGSGPKLFVPGSLACQEAQAGRDRSVDAAAARATPRGAASREAALTCRAARAGGPLPSRPRPPPAGRAGQLCSRRRLRNSRKSNCREGAAPVEGCACRGGPGER